MIADMGFKKQLWSLDPALDIVWNHIDNLWEIWRFPGQEKVSKKKWTPRAHHVMTIKLKGKKFRDLGADILLKLQMGDTQKFGLKQIMDFFEQQEMNEQRAKEKNLLNLIHDRNVDFANYVGRLTKQVPKEYILETPSTLRVRRTLSGGL